MTDFKSQTITDMDVQTCYVACYVDTAVNTNLGMTQLFEIT